MDLVLFGIQGSGKGTQAAFLWEKYRFLRFGSGHELREMVRKAETPHVAEIKEHLQQGTLVSEDIVFEALEHFLRKHQGTQLPIIFDGIPRNKSQHERFVRLMDDYGRKFIAMYFDISLSEALARIAHRRECSECGHPEIVVRIQQKCSKCGGELLTRADDENETIVLNRFETFYLETFPVIAELRRNSELMVIPAAEPPLQVFATMDLHIQKFHYEVQ